jgi:hypothetical protein
MTTIFKYSNDSKFFCEVCNNYIQRRFALTHFDGKKHRDNMIRGENKERITCDCGSLIRNTKSGIWNHNRTTKHLKYINTNRPL